MELGLLFTLTVPQVVDGGRQLCEVSVSEGLLGAHPLRRLRLQQQVGEVLGQRDLGKNCMHVLRSDQQKPSVTQTRDLQHNLKYLEEPGPRVPEALDAAVVAHLVRPVVGQAGHAGPRLLRRRPGHPEDLKWGKKSLVQRGALGLT